MSRLLVVVVASLAFVVLAPTAIGLDRMMIPTFGPANALPANLAFCEVHPDECAVDLHQPATIPDTQENRDRILHINVLVNTTIEPIPDRDQWGVADRWDYPTQGRGDCEDIQLEKRRRLIQAGFPRRALRLLVVTQEDGTGHMLLAVRLSTGEVVLDNLTHTVMPWTALPYGLVKMESTQGPGWVSLRPH